MGRIWYQHLYPENQINMKRCSIIVLSTAILTACGGSPIAVIDHNTLCTNKDAKPLIDCDYTVTKADGSITVKTANIGATISLPDSSITYFDSEGHTLEDGILFRTEKAIVSSNNWATFEGGYTTTGKNMDQVVANMRNITGRPGILPKYAAGFWYLGDSKTLSQLRNSHTSVDIVSSGETLEDLHGHLSSDITRGEVDFHNLDATWQALENEVLTAPGRSICSNPYWSILCNAKDPELQARIYQLAAFLPAFVSDAEPDTYYNKLRYSLIPYIYTLYGKAYFEGYTITRPLCMDFDSDIRDQFMFGPSLMVCPVYRKGERNREVYLPEGHIWYDYNHPSKIYEGGRTIVADAPMDRIPVFVPGGSIIAIGQKAEYVGEIRKNDRVDLDIDIYAGQDGYFEIYDDAGENDFYKTGSYSIVPVTYTESPRTIVIGTRRGEFRGMQKARNIHVAVYDKGKMKAINVYYEGSKIKISL